MKKVLLLCLMACLALSLFANGGGEGKKLGDVVYSPPGVLPIIEQGEVTINIMTSPHTTIIDDFENNTFTQELEEATGINLEFTYLPEGAGERKTKLNLLLSSGDYGDMINGNGGIFTLMEQQIYADQGILVALDPMIEEYGVYTKKAFEQFPGIDVKSYYNLSDGQMYGFPNLVNCYHCEQSQKMWVYEPWLDALGLDLPETTEDFYKMLVAFKNDDPNGNGIADEIPLAGAIYDSGWNANIDAFLMNAFIRYDKITMVHIENGKIIAPFEKEEWRDGLRYMKKLYDEGLVAPETFTQKTDQLMLMGENPDIAILGTSPGGVMGNFTQVNGESGRWAEYVGVPALEGPNGVRETGWQLILGNHVNSVITDNAKEPLAAFRLEDMLYDQEYWYFRSYFGIEGQDWRWAEKGELGINGEPGIWTELIPVNKRAKNTTWYQRYAQVQTVKMRLGRVVPDGPHIEKTLYEVSRDKMYPYASPRDTVLPPLIYSTDDAERVAELETTLEEFIKEMVPRFIVGDMSLDSDWDKYLDELDKIGLDEYLKYVQASYDKKMK